MLTDTLPTNAASSYETSPSRLLRAIVPPSIEKRGKSDTTNARIAIRRASRIIVPRPTWSIRS